MGTARMLSQRLLVGTPVNVGRVCPRHPQTVGLEPVLRHRASQTRTEPLCSGPTVSRLPPVGSQITPVLIAVSAVLARATVYFVWFFGAGKVLTAAGAVGVCGRCSRKKCDLAVAGITTFWCGDHGCRVFQSKSVCGELLLRSLVDSAHRRWAAVTMVADCC